jgi:hypothetical protein
MESGQYVDEELRSRLHTLATDFPHLWRDPNTPYRERKRLAHLLLEDVTLIKREQLLIHIRFPGGATRTLELPRPRRATVTQRSVIAEVDRLLDEHSHEAIANILNSRGSVSGYGKAFTGRMIGRVRVNRLGSKFGRSEKPSSRIDWRVVACLNRMDPETKQDNAQQAVHQRTVPWE